ncbi:Serine/Threonine-Protein Kinase Nek5 [Manis pentadactyla]|nr:Serine/Threonine-Protein Kinase Nek5 [Manis pentadactyla]
MRFKKSATVVFELRGEGGAQRAWDSGPEVQTETRCCGSLRSWGTTNFFEPNSLRCAMRIPKLPRRPYSPRRIQERPVEGPPREGWGGLQASSEVGRPVLGEKKRPKKQAPPRLRPRPGRRRRVGLHGDAPASGPRGLAPPGVRGAAASGSEPPCARRPQAPPRAPGGRPRPLSAGQRLAAGPGPAFPPLGRAGAVRGRRRAGPTRGERRSSKTRCKNTLHSEARRGGPRPRRSTSGCAGRPSACRALESPGPRPSASVCGADPARPRGEAGRGPSRDVPALRNLRVLETMDQYDVIKATGEGAFGKAYLAKGKSECKPCVIRDRFCKGKEVQISAHFQWCNQLAFHSVRKGIIFRFVFKRLNCNSQVSFVPTPKSIVQTATNVLLLKRKGKKEEKKIGLYVWYTLGFVPGLCTFSAVSPCSSHLRKEDFHRHWRNGSRPPSLLTRPSLGQQCLLGHFRGFLKAPAVTQQTPVMPQPCPQTFTGTGLSRGKVCLLFTFGIILFNVGSARVSIPDGDRVPQDVFYAFVFLVMFEVRVFSRLC